MSIDGEDEKDVSVEAARWLIELEEAPDDADLRRRFEVWRAASPGNEAAWAGVSGIYDAIGAPAYVAHRTARDSRCVADAPVADLDRARARRRRFLLPATALAIAACLAFVALPGVLLQWKADHVTSVAESRSVVLDDGSTVRLAPGSAIEVLAGAAAGGDRGVRLLRGEALFEVVPDNARRFRVEAGGVETTVLGTVFGVRLLEEGALIAVREGLVRVDRSAAPPVSERLTAGDWIRVEGRVAAERGAVPPAEIAAWQRGQIVARDRAIEDIVEEVGRSFKGVVLITDAALAHRRVTGVYNLDDPAGALRAAAGVHGGIVREVSPWMIVVSAR